MSARRNRPLVLIDIAVPRDIAADVQQINNVFLYDVDDLEVIVRENVRHRQQELARCQAIVGERTHSVMARIMPVREDGAWQSGRHSGAAWAYPGAAPCHG